MAYTIKNTDGTTLVLLGDGKIDTNSTSLTLVGKNYGNYGEIWNNNLIKLMGNFAFNSAPTNPVKGQLYYNTITKKLNIFDEEWEPLNGARVSPTQPAALSEGDFWWDDNNSQLYIETETGIKIVGPAFSSQLGDNGWVLPPVPIQDNANVTSGNVKDVTLLRNRGTTLGLISSSKFNIASTSTYNYITTATTSTVKGLTILGDIKVTENIYVNTLTVTSSIVYPESEKVAEIITVDDGDDGFETQINNFVFRMRRPSGSNFYPEVRTASSTATVFLSGYYIKTGVGSAQVITINRNGPPVSPYLTTTFIPMLDTAGTAVLNNIGDMMHVLLTDNTNLHQFRVTMQLVGLTGNQVSVVLEKLV